MAVMTVSEALGNFSDVVALCRREDVFLEQDGIPAAVVISPNRYERLMDALEESEDDIP